jgi:hypothetical protein
MTRALNPKSNFIPMNSPDLLEVDLELGVDDLPP